VATQYGLYLSKNGTTVRLPVNPAEYIIGYQGDNEHSNVLALGEIVIPREPKLAVISFESFFPGKQADPYVQTAGGFQEPEFYITLIKGYMADKEPVRFIANRYYEDGSAIFDTNIEIIVEDFQVTEKGGETGDFYYSITLSEYRPYEAKKVELQMPTASSAPKVAAAPVAAPQPVAAVSAPPAPAPKTTQTTVKAVATPQREVAPHTLIVDKVVEVSGYLYAGAAATANKTGYGEQSGAIMKISRIASIQNAVYPYHVTNTTASGWVKESQIKISGGGGRR
jgi:hypothetical protein